MRDTTVGQQRRDWRGREWPPTQLRRPSCARSGRDRRRWALCAISAIRRRHVVLLGRDGWLDLNMIVTYWIGHKRCGIPYAIV